MDKIKAIFTDLDYTILDHNPDKWDELSIEGLKKAQSNGTKVFIATARPYESVKEQGLFEVFNPDGLVCTNGCVTILNNKPLVTLDFPHELVNKVIEITKKYNIPCEINCVFDRFLTLPSNEYSNGYLKTFSEHFPDVRELTSEDKVSAILMFAPIEFDEILKNELPKDFAYIRFDNFGVDLCYYDVHKDYGIKKIMDTLNIKEDNCLGCGDESNDISIFKCCKYKVAVGNAKEDLKKAATYVSEDIKNSGIYKALLHYEVIKDE